MSDFIVYMHRNKVNGRVYIGMTCQPERRWNPYSYRRCPSFFQAIQKYGWDNFDHIILADGLTKEEAQKIEIEQIIAHDSRNREHGYNLAQGGECNMAGYKFTDEQKANLSKIRKGKGKGMHVSPSTEFKKGHGFSEEAVRKMSLAKKGKPPWNKGLVGYNSGEKNCMKRPEVAEKLSGTNNGYARALIQYSLDGKVVKEWPYMSAVQKEHGWSISNISKCCHHIIKSAYGYRWEYAPVEEEP